MKKLLLSLLSSTAFFTTFTSHIPNSRTKTNVSTQKEMGKKKLPAYFDPETMSIDEDGTIIFHDTTFQTDYDDDDVDNKALTKKEKPSASESKIIVPDYFSGAENGTKGKNPLLKITSREAITPTLEKLDINTLLQQLMPIVEDIDRASTQEMMGGGLFLADQDIKKYNLKFALLDASLEKIKKYKPANTAESYDIEKALKPLVIAKGRVTQILKDSRPQKDQLSDYQKLEKQIETSVQKKDADDQKEARKRRKKLQEVIGSRSY